MEHSVGAFTALGVLESESASCKHARFAHALTSFKINMCSDQGKGGSR